MRWGGGEGGGSRERGREGGKTMVQDIITKHNTT